MDCVCASRQAAHRAGVGPANRLTTKFCRRCRAHRYSWRPRRGRWPGESPQPKSARCADAQSLLDQPVMPGPEWASSFLARRFRSRRCRMPRRMASVQNAWMSPDPQEGVLCGKPTDRAVELFRKPANRGGAAPARRRHGSGGSVVLAACRAVQCFFRSSPMLGSRLPRPCRRLHAGTIYDLSFREPGTESLVDGFARRSSVRFRKRCAAARQRRRRDGSRPVCIKRP